MAWPQVAVIVTPTIRDVVTAGLAAHADEPALLELMAVMDARAWAEGIAEQDAATVLK